MKRLTWLFVLMLLVSCAAQAESKSITDVQLWGQQEMRTVDISMNTMPDGSGEAYYLVDTERNIMVMRAVNQEVQSGVELVAEIEPIYWPVDGECRDPQGVDALFRAQALYDYYLETFGWRGMDNRGEYTLLMLTNVDRMSDPSEPSMRDNNAVAQHDPTNRMVLIATGAHPGAVSAAIYPKAIAHEYVHGILYARGIEAGDDKVHTSPVHEAYADVLAVCFDKDGWVIAPAGRNLADPASSGCFDHMDQYDADMVYESSTILSHAAHIMYQGMPGGRGAIGDFDTLAKLFFKSMDFMYSQPTLYHAADALRSAADAMHLADGELTADQHECVYWALQQTGLYEHAEAKYRLIVPENGFELTLLDVFGNVYTDYRAELYRMGESEPSFVVDGAWGGLQYIYADESYDGGTLVLTDRADEGNSMAFVLQVSADAAGSEHWIHTVFGAAQGAEADSASDARAQLSAFYEEQLLPLYGHAAEGECGKDGLCGILTSAIEDLDGDGEEELLVIRGEWADGMYWLNMEVYEEEGGDAVSAGGLACMTDMIATDWYDVRAAFGLLERQDNVYVVMYNFFSMNDNSESFLIYRYNEDEGLRLVSGDCIWTYWNGAQILHNSGEYVERDAEPLFCYNTLEPDWKESFAKYAQDDYATGSDKYRSEAIARYKEVLAGWGMERNSDQLLYSDDDYETRDKLTADELISGAGIRWLNTLTSAAGWDNGVNTAYTLIEARDFSDMGR